MMQEKVKQITEEFTEEGKLSRRITVEWKSNKTIKTVEEFDESGNKVKKTVTEWEEEYNYTIPDIFPDPFIPRERRDYEPFWNKEDGIQSWGNKTK